MKLLALFCVFVAVYAKHEEYAGYKSYIVAPLTKDQLKAVGSMKIDFELDFLSIPALDRDGLIIVRPEYQDAFTKALDAAGVPYRVHVDDIVVALQKDDEMIEARHKELRMARGEGVSLPYDNYHRLEVIEKYLDDMARRFPDRATVISPATTFEGRPIKVLKISTTNFEDQTKPVIFVDAAIHAREWITPPTVTWAIHNLLENVTDPDLVENYDWILIPVLNPDGYEYTHEVMRFWRKNRSVLPSPIHRRCPGIDGNRNFGYRWNTVGVSDEPCSDIYPGRAPFSEAETVVVRDLLNEHLDRVALYIALHSFGSMIIHSWSNAASPPPDNIEDLSSVGTTMADAIMESQPPYFPQYVVGDTFNLLNYEASGSAEDYALSIGVPLAYIYELPGFGFGMLDGFHVHPRFIKQISIDTWAGIAAGAKHAGKLFRDSKK